MSTTDRQTEKDGKLKRFLRSRVFPYLAIAVCVLLTTLIVSLLIKISKLQKEQEALPAAIALSEPQVIEIPEKEEIKVTSIQLAEALQKANDLVTTKYHYTNADVYEKSKYVGNVKVPFTTDKTVFLYNGTIQAGITMSEISIDVDNEKKTVELKMPDAKLLSHEIDSDSFRFFDVKNSIFTSSSLEDYTDLVESMKQTQEETVRSNGFYDEVEKDARTAVKEFLSASGLIQDYQIKFLSE